MTGRPTVEQLDRELAEQALAQQRVLAAEQARAHALELDLAAERERSGRLEADLAAVREHLGAARAELQWLRRAGIDLNRVMDSRTLRAGRTLARGGRTATGRMRRLAGR